VPSNYRGYRVLTCHFSQSSKNGRKRPNLRGRIAIVESSCFLILYDKNDGLFWHLQRGNLMKKTTNPASSQSISGRRELLKFGVFGGTAVFCNALLPRAGVAQSTELIATTTAGRVRGAVEKGVNAFKGIPYGASTGAANRFVAPKPPEPWLGVRDALKLGTTAPQTPIDIYPLFASWDSWWTSTPMSEDCLVLNVWTPRLRDGAKRPVMVYLHGGGFSNFSGSRDVFNGANLARNGDVVVVTINHRLNAFGYLYLGHLDQRFVDSGNVGTLDTIQSLQWVRDNIVEFGGDPGTVTIFGQSGGGAKVNMLLTAPAANGLFHRAIVQSGAALTGLTKDVAAERTNKLLELLKIAPSDVARIQDIPWTKIVDAMVAGAKSGLPPTSFSPVVDGRTLPRDPFVPDAPDVSARVPLMIGNTATESTLLIGTFDDSTFNLDEPGLRKKLESYLPANGLDPVLRTFRRARPKATPSDLFFAITTARMWVSTLTEAELKAKQNRASVYLYQVAWETPVDNGKWRSPHSVEHGLVFNNVDISESYYSRSSTAQLVADQMSPAWIAFARSGDPNNSHIPQWPKFTENNHATMVFDVKSRVAKNLNEDEIAIIKKYPALAQANSGRVRQ
jgi:para-nitrobenzyl esterase